jgi:hypothetical protein
MSTVKAQGFGDTTATRLSVPLSLSWARGAVLFAGKSGVPKVPFISGVALTRRDT